MFIGTLLIILAFSLSRFLPVKLRLTYIFAILIRVLIAIININIGIPGGRSDAIRFFNLSLNMADYYEYMGMSPNTLRIFGSGTYTYTLFHSFIQRLTFEPSFFAAHCLSILISALTVIFIIKSYLKFDNSTLKGCTLILIIYNISPSIITNQTFVLRECFQSLIIVYLFYYPLSKFHDNKNNITHSKNQTKTLFYIFIIFFSFTIHRIFYVITPIIIGITLLFEKPIFTINEFKKIIGFKPSKRWFLTFLFAGIISLTFIIASSHISIIMDFFTKNPFLTSSTYLEGVKTLAGGSNYDNPFINVQNPLSIAQAFFLYTFAPLGISFAPKDLIVYPEKIFIFWIFISLFLKMKKVRKDHQPYLSMMVLSWFFINIIFSIVTSNWGTSLRHLVLSFSLLLIPYIYVSENLKNDYKIRKNSNH